MTPRASPDMDEDPKRPPPRLPNPWSDDNANPLGTNHWRRAARLGPRRLQQRLNTRNAGTLLLSQATGQPAHPRTGGVAGTLPCIL